MADLTGQQLKDSYQNLVTIDATIESNPTSGQLENGLGNPITALGIGTDSPATALEVVNNTSNLARLRVSTTATTGGNFRGYEFGSGSTFKGGLLQDESTDMISIFTPVGGQSVNIDSSGNVGIGTSPSGAKLDVLGNLRVRRDVASTQYTEILSGGGESRIIAKNNAAASFQALIFESGNNATTTERMRIENNGDISFRDGSASEAFYWDASEANLLLGLTTDAGVTDGLTIYKGAGTAGINLNANVYGADYSIVAGATGADALGIYDNDASAYRFIIDSSGNVGINGTSANKKLYVLGDTTNYQILAEQPSGYAGLSIKSTTVAQTWSWIAQDNSSNSDLLLYGGASAGTKLTIDSSGNVGIGTTSPARELSIGDGTGSPNIQLLASTAGNSRIEFGDTDDSDAGEIQYVHGSNNYMQFTTNGSEAMRIDSSGNVLVGTTTAGTKSGGGVIGFGSTGGIIENSSESVAHNGTLDIAINTPGGGYQGFLIVSNTVITNANSRTHKTFSVFGRGTDSSIQEIASDNGTSSASFTVTTPTNGVIRVTNTSGSTTGVIIQFFGGSSY